MKNKSLKLMSLFLILAMVLVGCGQAAPAPAAPADAPANEMQYVSKEDLKADIEAGSTGYIILDNRKSEDYKTSHIKGSVTADVDAANKGGDDAAGIVNLKAALTEATGKETGNPDAKYALVCYSGKSYAQKATDLLIEMGVSADNIYTLEGGIKAWEEAGDAYKGLLEQ